MMNINEISSNTFELHTDSVEFSPSGLQALVGSYELNEVSECILDKCCDMTTF